MAVVHGIRAYAAVPKMVGRSVVITLYPQPVDAIDMKKGFFFGYLLWSFFFMAMECDAGKFDTSNFIAALNGWEEGQVENLAGSASSRNICEILNGAVIISQDTHTMLGKIADGYDSDSIFNGYGTYGNEFSSSSIWNEFSEYGNEFNSYSPFNEFSSYPPMIIKSRRLIGYLSTNDSIAASISPALLKALCENKL